jgi:hypothetical protein
MVRSALRSIRMAFAWAVAARRLASRLLPAVRSVSTGLTSTGDVGKGHRPEPSSMAAAFRTSSMCRMGAAGPSRVADD